MITQWDVSTIQTLVFPIPVTIFGTFPSLNSEELPLSLTVHHTAEVYCENSMANLTPARAHSQLINVNEICM